METAIQPEKKYEVVKYFDDHYEGAVGKDLTQQQAKELCDKMNSQPRAYVNYSIREQLNKKG